MTRTLIALGLISAASTWACKPRVDHDGSQILTNQTNPNELAVDVNDLSYLLPRNAAGEIYPEIRVSTSWSDVRALNRLKPLDDGGTSPILTKPVYDSLVAATADQSLFGKRLQTPFKAGEVTDFEHGAFVITSFRIDPCAPSLALDKARTNYQNAISQQVAAGVTQQINQEISDIFGANKFTLSACQTQLRLILQPISTDKKTIKESTIHLVYTLNAGAGVMSDAAQADVQGLKKRLQDVTGIDTTGYLLQPHPGLAKEAAANQDSTKSGPAAQAVVEYLSLILAKYANPQVMAAIREKVVDGTQWDVVLGGGVSDPRETATYAAGPLVASTSKRGFIISSNADRRTWRMDPQPTRNTPVFDNLITFDPNEIDSPQHTALLNMMKKDDPESTHFFVNDCVTCHGTSQAFRQLNDLTVAATSTPRYKVPAGVSGFPVGTFLPPPPGGTGDKVIGVTLRNFGYSHGQPVIGLRTVTETAALADYFNRDLRRINNPGAACADKAEEKAWIAAIGLKDYSFAAGSEAREDALFASAGCATKVEGNAAIGTRGDGSNTPKVGAQQSLIFGQLSFSGQGITESGKGPVTVTLAKMGQAVVSQALGNNAPEVAFGTWSYVADANRVSQIKVVLESGPVLLAMNGTFLCEVPVEGQKARLEGCLALQAAWNKAGAGKQPQQPIVVATPVVTNPAPAPKVEAKPDPKPETPVGGTISLFSSADCSGSPVAVIRASTNCASVKSSAVRTIQIGQGECNSFTNPVMFSGGGSAACERLKAATDAKFQRIYYSDTCDPTLFVAAVGATTNCQRLDAQTLNPAWGRKGPSGTCRDITDDPSFLDGCNEYKSRTD